MHVFVFIYYRPTHILCKAKLLFLMRLMVINHYYSEISIVRFQVYA